MAPFEHADTAFASRAPFLRTFEPALLFPLPSFFTPCAPVRYGNIFHSQLFNLLFLRVGVESRVPGHQARHAAEFALLRFHCRSQQMPVARPLREHLVMRDDWVLRFLELYQLSELVGLACLSLADQLDVRFKHTQEFVGKLRYSLEDPCLGLPYHAAHPLRHGLQLFAQRLHPLPSPRWHRDNFLQHPAAVVENLPR